MLDNIYMNFTLNNRRAAVSAMPCDGAVFATDGADNKIFAIDRSGNTIECISSVRPYRRMRRDGHCGVTALGCCNGTARIYYLTDDFRETGYTNFQTGCTCKCHRYSELTDAMVTSIGNEMYIIGAFRQSAYLFDSDGKKLTKLCSTEDNEVLTDFVSLGNGVFAMGTLCGNTQTITVSDGETVQSGILPRGYTLRMLIPEGNILYGLFGRNYLYNLIVKIYENGALSLPK